MRIFKFLAVFAVVIGLVYIVVIGLNLNVFKSVFSNQEALADGSEWVEKTFSLAGLVDFIQAHPDLVSVTLSDTSRYGEAPTPEIAYESNQARVMAGTGHLVLLAAYAQHVHEGILTPEQTISKGNIVRFVVPGYEPSKNRETLRLLEETNGGSSDFSLDSVVKAIIQRNHQPSADALYQLIGSDMIDSTLAKSGISGIDRPAIWSVFHIAHALSSDSISYTSEYNLIADRMLNDDSIDAETILKALQINEIEYGFNEEKEAYKLLPKAHPSSMAQFMVWMMDPTRFGELATQIAKKHLGWPMNDSKVSRDFTELYAIYDNRISISHGVALGTSSYTNRTQVSTVYFDQLPVGFWMHMSSNLINQDYQMRLMYDPALYERSFNMLQLGKPSSTQSETN